jgi:lysophospholipase L1-like esterase
MPGPSGGSSSSSSPSGSGRFNPFGPHTVLASALIVVLVLMNVLVLAANNPNRKQGPHYYVAAGDSLSFGYQPNGDFIHGFADDLAAKLRQAELPNSQGQKAVAINLANYACAGETTTTMINGNCPFRNFLKEVYFGPQIDAVIPFLTAHKGNVSPVTFELGANDVFSDFDSSTCSVLPSGDADLKTMDDNLTRIDDANPGDPMNPKNGILQRLVDALRVVPPSSGPLPLGPPLVAGDLVMLNYYNPFAQACPNSIDFIHTLNKHLAKDAATFRIPVVDVYTWFDQFNKGAGMAANVCTLTWICNARPDIHPTTTGYQVISQAVEQVLGYPHFLPVPAEQSSGAMPPAVYQPRDITD